METDQRNCRRGMTYMEKPSSSKVLLDDTVPLTAVIEASQNVQSHTVSVYWKETSVSDCFTSPSIRARLHLSQSQTFSQCHFIFLYHHYV